MVVKTRNKQKSLRRSFRTRPSNQIPIIHVQHSDIKLFDDVSSDSEFLIKSPVLRRTQRKEKVQRKVLTTEETLSPISESDSDDINIEKLNAEYDMADDFTLYIENQDGIRMKVVGNKLVKYDEYHGVNPSDGIVSAHKGSNETNTSSADCERERRRFRKAAWSFVRGMLSSARKSTFNSTVEKDIAVCEKLGTFKRASIAVQPIEEAPETESTEKSFVPIINHQDSVNTVNTADTAAVETVSTAVISKRQQSSFLNAQQVIDTPKRGNYGLKTTSVFPHPLSKLSRSALSAVENMQECSFGSNDISVCLPQAQSTPFCERNLQDLMNITTQNENVLEKQVMTEQAVGDKREGLSFGLSPRWNNVTERSKSRLMRMRSQSTSHTNSAFFPMGNFCVADCKPRRTLNEPSGSSFGLSPRWNNVTGRSKSRLIHIESQNACHMDATFSSTTSNTFDEDNISVIPLPSELNKIEKEADVSTEKVLERNGSCKDAIHTLEEEIQPHCGNMERNATTNMTISNTYRNISYLRNESFIDIPYYLSNYPHFDGGTPLLQLLFVIEQTEVIEWRDLPKDVFDEPRKLGEGVYGEVFATTFNGQPTALKVIPFYGDELFYKEKVNGEYLLDAAGILPEVLINRELSALSDLAEEFSTPNFIQLLKINVVKGLYPKEFLEAWDRFDDINGSENDRPSEYASEQQLFVAIGMAMGGVDLEHYQMANENQVLSLLLQIAISLVVAEERLQFEHRDLHIGNVLVLESEEDLRYRFSGGDMVLRSYGVKAHLIDFTLSRMSKEGTTVFRDLEDDEELFAGGGNYQFDIYRMMRNSNHGDWLSFNPKSNCFWLHYLAVELISKRRCKKAIPKKRRRELRRKWDHLLEFDSLRELFTHDDFLVELQQHLIIKQRPCQ